MAQRVLSFHYVLTNNQGETLDSSRDGNPFDVLEGQKQIIPSLEQHLSAMNPGDRKTVNIPAADAYGLVREDLKIKVNRSKLPAEDIKPGMFFSAGKDGHGPVFTVIKIEGEEVYLNGNHPLAGVDLTFDIELISHRDATEEELTHGHAHGPEGHHH